MSMTSRRRLPLPLLATGAAAFVLGLYGGVLLLGRWTEPVAQGAPSEQQVVEAAESSSADQPLPTGSEGVYEAGPYTFSNVEVVNDGLGDFSIRADVTNNGEPCRGVLFTASIFETGGLVGTVSGTVQGFEHGETLPITLSGLSDFTVSWDQLQFQVDAEF